MNEFNIENVESQGTKILVILYKVIAQGLRDG